MRARVTMIVMSVATAVMTSLVVLLSMQMKPLRAQARELMLRKALPYIGQVQPTLRAVTLDGDSVTIGETASHRAQVLLFFSPSCTYCRETAPSWKQVAQALAVSRDSVDVLWVSTGDADSTRAWAAEHGLREPVVLMPRGKARATWRIKGVPLTLITDWQGQVRYVRPSVIRTVATQDSIVLAARTVSARVGDTRVQAAGTNSGPGRVAVKETP